MLNYFPKYFSNKAILVYFTVLLLVFIVFNKYFIPAAWLLFGIIEVIGFFYFSNKLSISWKSVKPHIFIKRIFYLSFIVKILWVFISYFLFINWNGNPFEWHAGDSIGYHELAIWLSATINENTVSHFYKNADLNFSDTGYPTYLGWLYFLTGNSILIPRILKALYAALSAVMIYKLGARTFDEQTGRISGIFVALVPNLTYYCGVNLKEIEMVFLTIAFINYTDLFIRSNKFSLKIIWLPIVTALLLFTFRTVLGVIAILSVAFSLVLLKTRILMFSKRILFGLVFLFVIAFFWGTVYFNEIQQVWNDRATSQAVSMKWRAEREGGNKFAKSVTSTVFAPMIFIIPFPTIVNIQKQEVQMFNNGSNFTKNIIAFFVFYALIILIKEKKWREQILLLSFTFGYLIVLALSSFAQSERFHLPSLSLLLVFSAYGITKITNKQKKYFIIYLVFVFFAITFWSWYKLAGRGLA